MLITKHVEASKIWLYGGVTMTENFPIYIFPRCKCQMSSITPWICVFVWLTCKRVSEGGRARKKERKREECVRTGGLCGVCVSVQLLRFRADVDGAEDTVVFCLRAEFYCLQRHREYGTCVSSAFIASAICPLLAGLQLVAAASNTLGSHIVQRREGWGKIDAALLWCNLERSPNLRYDLSLTDFHHLLFWFNHPLACRACCASLCGQFELELRGSRGCGVEWGEGGSH